MGNPFAEESAVKMETSLLQTIFPKSFFWWNTSCVTRKILVAKFNCFEYSNLGSGLCLKTEVQSRFDPGSEPVNVALPMSHCEIL